MKKMLSFLIVIALLVPTTCFAELSPKDFVFGGDVTLGMPMDTVKAMFGQPSQSSENQWTYTQGVTFSGLSATISFELINNMVSQIVLFFDLLPQAGMRYTSDFDAIDISLLSLYPNEAYTGLSSWLDNDYENKNDLESAITDGALILMSDFKQSGFEVQHFLQFIGAAPLHTVTFLPAS